MKRNHSTFLRRSLEEVAQHIRQMRQRVPTNRGGLTAITGIDGCGKGYVTAQLQKILETAGIHVGVIGVDGWLNLPHKRFHDQNPAEHFYHYALRFDEMFARLIFPLREKRSLRLEADFTEETATTYSKHLYKFEDIDIILVEGIYLLKRAFQSYYDLSVWIDCKFATALGRAIARAQEGLTPEETIHAYHTIYFPAQQIHFRRDSPAKAATLMLRND